MGTKIINCPTKTQCIVCHPSAPQNDAPHRLVNSPVKDHHKNTLVLDEHPNLPPATSKAYLQEKPT